MGLWVVVKEEIHAQIIIHWHSCGWRLVICRKAHFNRTGEWYIGTISLEDDEQIYGSIEMRFTAYYQSPTARSYVLLYTGDGKIPHKIFQEVVGA